MNTGASTFVARLGRAIRTRRKSLGFTEEGFADHIGMNRTRYGIIERGKAHGLRILALDHIARGLGLEVADLVRKAEVRRRGPQRR